MACLKDFNGNEIFDHELNPTQKAYITGTPICEDDHITPQVFDENVYLGETAGSLYATTFYGALSGNASTATKLTNTSTGSATQPVYFSDGKPVATTYTLGKSVPSDAVFTDTTYTALPNPNILSIKNNGSKKVTYDGSAFKSLDFKNGSNTTVTVTDAGEITIDARDVLVQQVKTDSDSSHPLLLAPGGQNANAVTTTYFDSGVTLNPGTNTISANISGNAYTASKLGTSDVGSASEPIYIKAGVPTKCTGILTTSNWSNYITTIAVFG